jgi:N-acetyltransferase
MNIQPLALKDHIVHLAPMSLDHVDALAAVGLDPSIWQWVPTPITTISEMRAYVESALREQTAGTALPFVIVDAASAQVIGSTRYGAIEPKHRRLEIGWTWITPAFQRTPINSHAKWLLLSHAFETLGAHRVELKTDALNTKSRSAILRIGAKEEGTLRKHVITQSGRIRDTVYYSILDTEWPAVKAKLATML